MSARREQLRSSVSAVLDCISREAAEGALDSVALTILSHSEGQLTTTQARFAATSLAVVEATAGRGCKAPAWLLARLAEHVGQSADIAGALELSAADAEHGLELAQLADAEHERLELELSSVRSQLERASAMNRRLVSQSIGPVRDV